MRSTPRRSLAFGLSAVVAAGLLSALAPASSAAAPDPERRVIVTFSGDAAAAAAPGGSLRDARGTAAARVAEARKALDARQESFLAEAKRKGIHAGTTRKFNLLVNAVAMTVPAAEVAKLSALPGVTGVYPDAPVRSLTDVSVPHIGADKVWERTDGNATLATGAGVTIAVIDTGIDYTHPDLGGGLGAGHKVVGGYDFANDDADPMDDQGHGTHVAGIIAGKAAAAGGVTGVAPDASLLAYKALDEYGYGETSDIVAAIEAASDPANPHRADVINLSLGGYADGLDPLGLAATAASNAGIVVVAAAGNAGPGYQSVGSPAAADGVIAVGASVSGITIPIAYLNGDQPELLQTYRGIISANPSAGKRTADLVDVGYGSPQELDAAGDLTGKVVLVNDFVADEIWNLWESQLIMAREIQSRGGIAMIGGQGAGGGGGIGIGALSEPNVMPAAATSIGNGKSPIGVTEDGHPYLMDSLVVLGVDGGQYAELSQLLSAGPVKVTIEGKDATDQIASFSSRGPSQRWGLKPDLVAPGYEIRSTVPTDLYGTSAFPMSGTSMAAPHVAGAAALLRQLRPDQSATQLSSALIGSAKPLTGTGVVTHGSGRLDVVAAADATLSAQPPTLSFGVADLSTAYVTETATVTLHNRSAKAATATLSADNGDVTVKPSQVNIAAGKSTTVTVTLKAKRPDLEADFSGWITAKVTGAPNVTIPYLSIARPLVVKASPDPSDGSTTVWVQSYLPLAGSPVVTVDSGKGGSFTPTVRRLNNYVFSAEVTGAKPGAYAVTVKGQATTGQQLIGRSGFEVTPEDSRKARWEPVGPNSEGGQLTLDPNDASRGLVSTDGKAGPWLTKDKGKTWTQLNRLPVAWSDGYGSLVIDSRDSRRFWYAVNESYSYGRILRTDDDGVSWRTLTVPNSSAFLALLADSQNRVLIGVTRNELLISGDGGESWTSYPVGVAGEVLEAQLHGDDLYLRTGRGIWKRPGIRSGVPGAPTQIYSTTNQFVSGMAFTSDSIVATVWSVGVVTSLDAGQTWNTTHDQTFGIVRPWAAGDDVFVATIRGYGLTSADRGRTWSQTPEPSNSATMVDYDRWADGTVTMTDTAGLYNRQDSGFQRIGVQGATVHDLAIAGDHLLAGTSKGIYRTQLPVANPEWGAADGEGYIGAGAEKVAVSPSDPQVVWKARAMAFGGFAIDHSTDGGQTFTEVGTGLGAPTSVLVHPADPQRVAFGFANFNSAGLVVTTNGGQSWKNLYHNWYYDAMVGDPQNPKRLWLGNQHGLYRSDDGGTTVAKVLDGQVTAISFEGSRMVVGGEQFRVSTDGGKTFRVGDAGPLELWVSDMVAVGDTLYAATKSYHAYGVAKGGRGVLRSTDGGMTWHNMSNGLQNLDVTSLAVSADGKWLFVGTELGGVHRMPLS